MAEVKNTTAATGDIVRPKLDVTAASTPKSMAAVRSVALTAGSTALQNATEGAVPDPPITAKTHGKKLLDSFPAKSLPEIVLTST